MTSIEDTVEFDALPSEDQLTEADGIVEVTPNTPQGRRLRALARDRAYVFITAGEDGTDIDFSGIYPEDLPIVLQEVLDLVVEKLP